MNKIVLVTLTLLIGFINLNAQKLVEATLIDTKTKEELNLNPIFIFIGVTVENGVNTYKILYETIDTDGTIDTASGVLVLPILETEEALPIVAYQHGTSSSKEDVPSRLNQEVFLLYYFVGNGFIGTAADYLGLGDSRRVIHPYIHADSEASAGIDLIRASKAFMDSEEVLYNDQLFLTGYSQGGHASMAMHQEIETNLSEEFTVTAASHMSGPYNLSNTIVNSSIAGGVYDFPSYIVWMVVSYQSVYGNLYEDLATVFRPEFVPTIQDFTTGVITRGELNTILIDQLTELYGASVTNNVFTEAFLADMQTNSDNTIQTALRDNDLFNWVPTAPTQLLYCMADEQVPFTNAVITDSIMNSNGAANVTSIDINSEADHRGCVVPATENTANFFLQFVNSTTNALELSKALEFSIYPNPVNNALRVKLPETVTDQSLSFQLFSLEGRLLLEGSLQPDEQVDISSFSNGFYWMKVQSDKGYWVEKMVVSK